METMFKCAGLAVTGALLAMAVRKQSGEFAVLVGILALAALGVLALEFLKPVLEFARRLQDRSGLSQGVMAPVVKTLAIGFLTELGKGICEEAGEKTLGGGLQVAGSLAALYVMLPLMESVLDLLEQLL